MKLHLHIGTEKTGTTTIQEVLFNNRRHLNSHGFHFLQSAGPRNNRAIPAYCMIDDKFDDFFKGQRITTLADKIRFRKKFKSKLDKEIKALPKHIHSVIISSEHFHSRINSNEEVTNVWNLLSEYFSEINVVCYVREQSATCSSLYSTAIKAGSIVSFDKFLTRCRPGNIYYNYYNMLSNWRDVFGQNRLTVSLFSRESFVNGDLIDDFFHRMDPKILKNLSKNIQNENESLTKIGQLIGQVINQIQPKYHQNGRLNLVRIDAIKAIYQEFKGKGEGVSQADHNRIYNDFNESNTQLNEEFLGGENNIFSHKTIIPHHNTFALSKDEVEKITRLFSVFTSKRMWSPEQCADLFRDAAVNIENKDLERAYKLMVLASIIRPNGPFIRKRIETYRVRVQEIST